MPPFDLREWTFEWQCVLLLFVAYRDPNELHIWPGERNCVRVQGGKELCTLRHGGKEEKEGEGEK